MRYVVTGGNGFFGVFWPLIRRTVLIAGIPQCGSETVKVPALSGVLILPSASL
jgi:hypothetical protein